ncbi:MAG: tetratricopeptide repeat protein [Planctomycetes bacterium]|nr:tetratricopeptide repeat protein [Planctomycetota bacterium]
MKHYFIIAACVLALFFVAGCELPPNANTTGANAAANQPPVEDPFDPDRPPTAKTLYLMADMLQTQGKDVQAEQLYRRILAQYPEFSPAYNDLASLLMRQRRIPEAMKILEAGLELRASDPVLLNNTGMCWLIRKRYQNALDYFTKASAVIPENTRYRSNMATALSLMGRREEALALYRQILPEKAAQENVRLLQENIKLLK